MLLLAIECQQAQTHGFVWKCSKVHPSKVVLKDYSVSGPRLGTRDAAEMDFSQTRLCKLGGSRAIPFACRTLSLPTQIQFTSANALISHPGFISFLDFPKKNWAFPSLWPAYPHPPPTRCAPSQQLLGFFTSASLLRSWAPREYRLCLA